MPKKKLRVGRFGKGGIKVQRVDLDCSIPQSKIVKRKRVDAKEVPTDQGATKQVTDPLAAKNECIEEREASIGCLKN